MASMYQVYQPAIQPPFAKGPYGNAWGYAFGLAKDQLIAAMKLGVQARMAGIAPLGAIGELSQERSIYQGIFQSETTADYIPRLLNAWGAWTIGGTYWGLLAELNGSGYDSAYIVAANGFIYGPSGGVTAPDPINGIAGNPPAWTQLNPWYTQGSAATDNEWQASTAYALNAIVTPSSPDGTYYLAIQNGTSGGSEPSWPSPGGSVVDGGVTWLYLGNYLNLPYNPPWTISGGADQGDPGLPLGGPPSPDGKFWSRFLVMFDPVPGNWFSITNPPTNSTLPTEGEINFLQTLIERWKPAKSQCGGILAIEGSTTKACIAWPPITTTNIQFSCWLSRAITAGDTTNSTDFVQGVEQTVYSWLPNQSVANSGGSTYIFMVPSFYYQSQNLGGGYVFSSPASSGTTGTSEPSWPTSIGGTVTDNGITWTCVAQLAAWSDGTGVTCFQG